MASQIDFDTLSQSGFLVGRSKPLKQASVRFFEYDWGTACLMYKKTHTGVSSGSVLPIASVAKDLTWAS
jgi:hypothetical protein